MVHECCAKGCSSKFRKGSGLSFFRFPTQTRRRNQWLLALRRENFKPSSNSRICEKHFITGKPSKDSNDPDYVPSVFDSSSIPPKIGRFTRKALRDSKKLPVEIITIDSENDASYNSGHHSVDPDYSINDKKKSGQPSRDKKDPDYVSSVFSTNSIRPLKGKPTRKALRRSKELPVLSSTEEVITIDSENDVSCTSDHSNYSIDPDFSLNDDSESDSEEEVRSKSKTRLPVLEHKIQNSPLISIETVNRILESDAANTPTTMPAESSVTKKRFIPQLFTFVDINGKIIKRFVEKRVKKNARPPKQSPHILPQRPIETVQVIIDKKRAQTVAVDRKALCISRTSELCNKNKGEKTCGVDLSEESSFTAEGAVKNLMNGESKTLISKACISESDSEEELSSDDYFRFFSELKDFKQEDKYLEIEVKDGIPVLR